MHQHFDNALVALPLLVHKLGQESKETMAKRGWVEPAVQVPSLERRECWLVDMHARVSLFASSLDANQQHGRPRAVVAAALASIDGAAAQR